MSIMTLAGIVENGQIRLTGDVRLPENTAVFVVVPGADNPPAFHVGSPRLANPEQASDFRKTVVDENSDARL